MWAYVIGLQVLPVFWIWIGESECAIGMWNQSEDKESQIEPGLNLIVYDSTDSRWLTVYDLVDI